MKRILYRLIPQRLRLLVRIALENLRAPGVTFREALSLAFESDGVLDYHDQRIVMEVTAHRQTDRLRACKKEPETVDWIDTFVKPGDTFCDVGANVGSYTLIASHRMRGEGEIYAFEPSFSTFASLCRNIIMNRLSVHSEIIFPFPIVLFERKGVVHFSYKDVNPGFAMHTLTEVDGEKALDSSVFTQTMLAYPLDQFIEEFSLKTPTHLKIDVDGSELQVLRGAVKTLRSNLLRTLLIEVDEGKRDTQEILSLIRDAGLIVHSKTQRRHVTTYNYIFIKP